MKKAINRWAFELINGTYMLVTIVIPLVLSKYNLIPVQLAYVIIMSGMVSIGLVCALTSDILECKE